ncbi:hypothetical protein CXG50_17815 [Pseudomonas plecoglossicida]|jgi:hypothetical protein|uniref:Lipoprotein n=5 Tax=Pseudomonas TaxID=286 RepID=A0A0P7DCM3_PSEPU|nr:MULTISPECIES: hypothetical protein [Pseudomonas]KXK69474.1 hypothetical protein BC89_19275 [Pseudomonas monteilii]MRF41486.1 hypothetical protein [Escherichia coli]GJB83280.1 hypothetical protein KAM380_077450 [Aeromonas caviae]AGA74537.1 hypothetical protein B479_18225 [Pseudomonas putida HB3267]KKO15563.1 hypothetical protein V520_11550 [Pseudomonas putida KG-4]
MSTIRNLTAAALIALTTGCATGLNSAQESELASYRARNLAVEEKSPGLAAGLGLLPGGGSFYGRAYGFGVVNLLFWPLSILWDPVSGHDAAEMINYQATKAHVATLKKHDMDELDAKLESDSIDLKRYTLDKRRIDEKYNL